MIQSEIWVYHKSGKNYMISNYGNAISVFNGVKRNLKIKYGICRMGRNHVFNPAKELCQYFDCDNIYYDGAVSTIDLKGEIWVTMVNHDINYMISNMGRVKHKLKHWEIILNGQKNNGYLMIAINKKSIMIHRLVGEYFITNEENKPQINHKDGNRSNNCVENLEWVTGKENTAHAWESGFCESVIAKRKKIVVDIITGVYYTSIKEASKYNIYSQSYLNAMIIGRKPNKTNLRYA